VRQNVGRLSFRELFAYWGPALIVSMAYMDPGNYGTDIAAGASFRYGLLWAVWMANVMAMLLQYMSGKLGIASGRDLAELVRESLHSRFDVLLNWVGAEAAAAATDLAEYLGTVLALNILFKVPMLYASIFGAADVLILLALTSKRFRALEYFFILSVSIISFGFLYDVIIAGFELPQIAQSFVSPRFGSNSVLLVVGIIGATVMPHALYVHSSLTRNKLLDSKVGEEVSVEEKKRHLKLHTYECIPAFLIAGSVNAAILIVSAVALNPSHSDVSAVNDAYRIMIPIFGSMAAIVFAVTLLFSGLASSATGTLAGQSIMEGLLGRKIHRNIRRIVTRGINVFPTTIAVLLGVNPFDLLIYSQVLLSLMIALPMIPLIFFTAKKELMGQFVNRSLTTALAVLFGTLIIGLNTYLIYIIVAPVNILLQALILGAYGVYHIYLVYATLR
jgi:manganese transport protein